jgi:hypothetical protein
MAHVATSWVSHLVAVYGWYRHKLELEGQRIVAAYYAAIRSLADERGKDSQKLPD